MIVGKRRAWGNIVIFIDSINLKFKTLRVNIVISLFACSFQVIRAIYPLGVWSSTHNTNNYNLFDAILSKTTKRRRQFVLLMVTRSIILVTLSFICFSLVVVAFKLFWRLVWLGRTICLQFYPLKILLHLATLKLMIFIHKIQFAKLYSYRLLHLLSYRDSEKWQLYCKFQTICSGTR